MNGDTGWFNARLKNLREAQKKLNKKATKTSIRKSSTRRVSSAVDQAAIDKAIVDDVIFLKSLVVSDKNMDIFIQKLNFTRIHRNKMLLDKNIHLKEQFPYFFTNPEMVT